MTLTDTVTPIIKGVIVVFLLCLIGYLIYWVIKHLGLGKMFKKKEKIDETIYQEVADSLARGETFNEIAELFNNKPLPIQQKYVQAYLELRQLN